MGTDSPAEQSKSFPHFYTEFLYKQKLHLVRTIDLDSRKKDGVPVDVYLITKIENQVYSEVTAQMYETWSWPGAQWLNDWYSVYPRGAFVFFKGAKMIGGFAAYPLKKTTYDAMCSFTLTDLGLDSSHLSSEPTGFWYVAEFVFCKKYYLNQVNAKLHMMFLEKVLANLLTIVKESKIHEHRILAEAWSIKGENFLRRLPTPEQCLNAPLAAANELLNRKFKVFQFSPVIHRDRKTRLYEAKYTFDDLYAAHRNIAEILEGTVKQRI